MDTEREAEDILFDAMRELRAAVYEKRNIEDQLRSLTSDEVAFYMKRSPFGDHERIDHPQFRSLLKQQLDEQLIIKEQEIHNRKEEVKALLS